MQTKQNQSYIYTNSDSWRFTNIYAFLFLLKQNHFATIFIKKKVIQAEQELKSTLLTLNDIVDDQGEGNVIYVNGNFRRSARAFVRKLQVNEATTRHSFHDALQKWSYVARRDLFYIKNGKNNLLTTSKRFLYKFKHGELGMVSLSQIRKTCTRYRKWTAKNHYLY